MPKFSFRGTANARMDSHGPADIVLRTSRRTFTGVPITSSIKTTKRNSQFCAESYAYELYIWCRVICGLNHISNSRCRSFAVRWLADSSRQSCKSAIDYILWQQLQVNAKSLLSSETYGAQWTSTPVAICSSCSSLSRRGCFGYRSRRL